MNNQKDVNTLKNEVEWFETELAKYSKIGSPNKAKIKEFQKALKANKNLLKAIENTTQKPQLAIVRNTKRQPTIKIIAIKKKHS